MAGYLPSGGRSNSHRWRAAKLTAVYENLRAKPAHRQDAVPEPASATRARVCAAT
jgi:hypothetical protein